MTSIRVLISFTLQPHSQTQVLVFLRMKVLIVTEPKGSISTKLGVRVMNSVDEVMEIRPFTILLSNFSRQARRRPKSMVVALASRSPLALVSLTSGVAHERCAIHDLFSSQEEKEPWEVDVISDSEGENTRDTEYLTDAEILALLRDEKKDKHHPQSLRWFKKKSKHQARLQLRSQPRLLIPHKTIYT